MTAHPRESRTAADDTSFLLTGAAWQDSLLQSYRLLALSTQSIMLAVGVLMLGIEFGRGDAWDVSMLFGALGIVAAISAFAIVRMQRVVKARGLDVDYWHTELLKSERQLPSADRAFTRFKVQQREQRNDGLNHEFLADVAGTEPDWTELVGGGSGHTRRAIDEHLFAAMLFAWAAILLVGLVHLVRVLA